MKTVMVFSRDYIKLIVLYRYHYRSVTGRPLIIPTFMVIDLQYLILALVGYVDSYWLGNGLDY